VSAQEADETLPVLLIDNAWLKPVAPVRSTAAVATFGMASEDFNNMHAWLVNDGERLFAKLSLFLNRLDDNWTMSETVWPFGSPMPKPTCVEETLGDFPNRAARAANALYRSYLKDGFRFVRTAKERSYFKVHMDEQDGEELEAEDED